MISPGEWDDAVKVRFGANLPASAGGGTVAAEIMAMSDADNLYVAYRYDRDTSAFGQSHAVEVDANQSGGPNDGDDAWLFTPGIGFFDDYRGPCLVNGTMQSCAPQDTTDTGFGVPGTNDGGAAIAFSPEATVVEMWHPYHDGDLRDAQAKPGDSLPMSFFIRLLDSCPDFPRCYGDTWFPDTFQYRPFLLACGAPPPPPDDDADEDIIEVHIDVKPGDPVPTIHLGAAGVTPVAVLGSDRFDVTRVDPASVFFAGAPVVVDQGVPRASVQDVNGDGTADLVAEFETSALQLTVRDRSASLAGKTRAGRRFHGTDAVRVIP
ncbi:MAG: hypothetical protein ACJ79M_23130 [Myxococcales bacterium]